MDEWVDTFISRLTDEFSHIELERLPGKSGDLLDGRYIEDVGWTFKLETDSDPLRTWQPSKAGTLYLNPDVSTHGIVPFLELY